jgi:CHAT domain-containing protein/tetratricopeptide (TPR) repeat protein
MKYLFVLVISLLSIHTALTQTADELNNQAKQLYKKGQYTQAIPLVQKAISISKRDSGETHLLYATSLSNLATLYSNTRQYSEAEALYIQAREIRKKKLGEIHPAYAETTANLGKLYRSMLQFDKAELLILAAKNIWEKMLDENHSEYVAIITSLAELYRATGQYEKSEPLYIKAKAITKELFGEAHPSYIKTIMSLSVLYRLRGQYNKAELLLSESNETTKKTLGETHPDYADGLFNLAELYKDMKQFKKSEPLYIKAKEIREKTLGENHPDYAGSINNLAELYRIMGNYGESETLYIKAKEIRKKILGDNHPDYGASVNGMAVLYYSTGQYKKAEKLLIEAKEIGGKTLGENHPDYAAGTNNLAELYRVMGQYAKAEPLLIEAKNIWRKTLGNTHPNYASVLNNLAELYKDIGQYKKAEFLYIEAIEIMEKIPDNGRSDYAASLNNLAGLYHSMKQYAKAEILLLKAKEVFGEKFGENHPSYAKGLNNLSILYKDMQRYEEAEKLGIQSKEIRQKELGKSHPDYANSLVSLARLHYVMEQYGKAEPLYIEAKGILSKVLSEMHPDYAAALNSMSLFYNTTGKITKAEELLLSVTNIKLNNLKKIFAILSEKEKQNYLLNNIFILENNNNFIFNHKCASSKLRIKNFELLLFLKALTLFNTRTMLETVASSTDSNIRQLFINWQTAKRLLAKQYTLPITSRMPALDSVEALAEAYEKELVRRSAGFDSLQTELKISMKDVQQSLQPGEAVVEFVKFNLYNKKWTDSTIYAAYILRKNDTVPIFVPLCEEKQLQQLLTNTGKGPTAMVNLLYPLKNSQRQNGGGMGKKLYNLVWQPLEEYLTAITKIAYSPAGSLYGIAFHALPVSGTKLLMDKYQLQQYASTRQITSRTGNKENTRPQSIALFGNALFTMDSAAIVKSQHKKDFSGNLYIPRGRGDCSSPWKPLSGTGEEVKKIKQLFVQNKITTTAIFTGAQATEQNLKALSGQSPQVLHIATHGFFCTAPQKRKEETLPGNGNAYKLAEDPLLRTGLVLAGGNYAWAGKQPIDGVEDGIATAYEIAQLDLRNTELAVLSACETALGDVIGSEGVYGLQRAFKLAGVKKMIVSLWRVDDTYTAELMIAFYAYRLKGRTIKEAFDAAQNGMRKKYPPYHWAGFVLTE